MILILLASCESPSASKTIAATYEPIEVNVNSSLAAVTPKLGDSSWKGTWEAANLPEGLIIDPANGAISGTPTTVSAKADYSITLTGTGDFAGVDGEAAVSITVLLHALLNLSAAQLEIIDGTKSDGTMKHASNFMMFDITTSDTVSSPIAVEFLLVKNGDAVPSTLEEFRKSVAISLTSSQDLVMAHSSAIFPSQATSLYLAHDSEGNYPLTPGTGYALYAVQPLAVSTTPASIGTFTTGTHVDPSAYGDIRKHIEDPGTASPAGRFYMKNGQFMVLTSLIGEAAAAASNYILTKQDSESTPYIDIAADPSSTYHTISISDYTVSFSNNKPTLLFWAIYTNHSWATQLGSEFYWNINFIRSENIIFYSF